MSDFTRPIRALSLVSPLVSVLLGSAKRAAPRVGPLVAPLVGTAAMVVSLGGCKGGATRTPFDASDPEATAARLRKHLERHPDDIDARRDLAHIEWIWLGDADEATAQLTTLRGQGDTAAQLSALLMARARQNQTAVADLSYRLIEDAVTAKDGPDAFAEAAIDVAARSLQQSHGDRPGDDKRFSAFFDKHHDGLARLPFSVRQPLLSLRASIARRLDEPYKALFEEQGCVQAWEASPLWGRLGDYELEAMGERAFEADPDADVVPLSCVVRVWNPTPRSGIRKLRTTVSTDSDILDLDISGQESLRVWLDGKPIHRTDDTKNYSARRHRVRVPVKPGAHVLEVATVISGDKSWILVRAADGSGAPVVAKADGRTQGAGMRGKASLRRPAWPDDLGPFKGPMYAPLRAYLATDAALADGDTDAAERVVRGLEGADAFAEGWLMRAAFERNDRSRPRTNSASREQTALEEALALQPDLDGARIPLLELMLRRGDDTEATAMLESLPAKALHSVEGELLRYQAYRARGKEHLATEALDRAKAIDPGHCRVLRFQRNEARERSDVRSEDRLVAALSDCAGSIKTRAGLAETRGEWAEAKALWETALDRKPDDLETLEALARLSATSGNPKEAEAYLRTTLGFAPMQVGAHVALADLALQAGNTDEARALLEEALGHVPFSNALRSMAADLGQEDALLEYRVDGLKTLRDYQASGSTYEGAGEALVLDRSVVQVYEGGGLRQVVHIMVHLLSKEALDRYGEMETPGGARLLTLRSIKPDGQIFEPELVPGKDGVSLRHLAVGDFVEYEYVIEQAPSGVVPGYVDVSTFRFQSYDVPYHRSELMVLHPTDLELLFDKRNSPPAITKTSVTHNGQALTLLSMGVDEMPRLGVEPGARAVLEEVPNVRIFTKVDVDAWLRSLAASVYYARRTNPELRRLTRRLIKGKTDDEQKLRALWTWVVENVDDGGDLSSAATATFATRRGNRLGLLATMLDQAGIPSELWLARSEHGPRSLPGGHPMIESYEAPMLAVTLEGRSEPLMVMTASKVMPLGYLPPSYAAAAAVRVPVHAGDEAGITKTPPATASLLDRRRWEVDIEVDLSGAATVTGVVSLLGGEAIAWRQALREVDEDRVRELFQQAELGWLQGGDLTSLEIEGADTLEAPLDLRFEATASLGVVQDGALVLRSDFVPLNLGGRYVALPNRVTGMVVPYAPEHDAVFRVKIRDGRFSEVPKNAKLESDFGAFERTVDGRAGGAEVELRYRSTLNTGVVPAQRYRAFSDYARRVESATTATLRATAG